MLDKVLLLSKINNMVPEFIELEKELESASLCFDWIKNNQALFRAISKMDSKYLMPTWLGSVDEIYELKSYDLPYNVLAVDGSQIYPDRHQGISCFLLNIGFAYFEYGAITSKVKLSSLPSVYNEPYNVHELSSDIIDCRRTELELSMGCDYSIKSQSSSDKPYLFLFDGSLIFWHLESKDPETKDKFLKSYLSTLEQLYQGSILNMSFISLPKSKELVNVIKTGISNNIICLDNLEETSIESVVDSDICDLFLKPLTRSTIFYNHSPIVKVYPEHLRPCFIYINLGQEMVRVEFPSWMLKDTDRLEMAFQIVMDQCIKGNGYPISLAEAHEAAVVKARDRDFFYDLLHEILAKHSNRYTRSAKSFKKKYSKI